MSAYCAANGISLLPYGTVAGGLLSDKYLNVPASRHAAQCPQILLCARSRMHIAGCVAERGNDGAFKGLEASGQEAFVSC